MEIVLTGPNSKLFDELVKVLNAYKRVLAKEALTEDLPASLRETIRFDQFKEAAKSTYHVHKREGLRGSGRHVVRGVGSSVVNVLYSPIVLTKNVKKETLSIIKRFKEIEDDKEKLVFIMENFSYLASTGAGMYFGYNLPDKDISYLGIGGHRNFAFHSVVPALTLLFLGKFLNRVLDRVDTDSLSDRDKSIHRIFKKNLSVFVSGGVIGIATHLAVDATLQGSKAVTSPWGNTWVKGTLIDDQGYLGFNGFSCCNLEKKYVPVPPIQ